MKRLFVAGISYDADDTALASHFEQIGKVVDAHIIVDRETGKSKGFGFVEMETEELAKEAIAKLDNSTLLKRTLHVKVATPRPQPVQRPERREAVE